MKTLIEVVNGEPTVSTVTIAKEFGRLHKNVLKDVKSLIETNHLDRLHLKPTEYIDSFNRKQVCFVLTERDFLIAMPFIGGTKARDGQVRLVDSFIKYRDEVRRLSATKAVRELARMEYRPMTDAIKESKEVEGKVAAHYHYSNEADLINRIVLGMTAAKFRITVGIGKSEAIRDHLNEWQIKIITDLQRADTTFIAMGWSFDKRKEELLALFERKRTLMALKAQPNQPVINLP